jgi:hypothetical protein
LSGGSGWLVWPLLLLRDEDLGLLRAAMAGAAGDRVGGLAVADLGEISGVDVGSHFDHDAGRFFDRVCVGGEVVALGIGVAEVTEGTLDPEVALELMHELVEIVAGDVFGKSFDVGWIGTGAPGWSCGLGCGNGCARWSGRGSVLSNSKGS